MKVAIRLVDGKDIFIEDAYSVSALPDDFFVRVLCLRGTITINRNQIKLIERFYKEGDKNDNN